MCSGDAALEYRRANKWKAAFLFLFSWEKYHELAINHSMAKNLEAKDLREAFERGTFPSDDQKTSAETNIRKFSQHLRQKLVHSFLWSLLVACVVIVGAFVIGVLSMATVTLAKTVTFAGTFLVAWATLFEVGGVIATFKGEALHELIRPVLFLVLFALGVLLVLAGILL
jgi:hypothetical protein